MFLSKPEKQAVDFNRHSRRSQRRRSHRRHPSSDISVELLDGNTAIQYECPNISPVGVYLLTELLLFPGDEVNLRIRLSARQQPMVIVGKVVRVDTGDTGQAPGMGISFTDISTTDSKELKLFLMRRFLSNG